MGSMAPRQDDAEGLPGRQQGVPAAGQRARTLMRPELTLEPSSPVVRVEARAVPTLTPAQERALAIGGSRVEPRRS